jgi:hypothetical protein
MVVLSMVVAPPMFRVKWSRGRGGSGQQHAFWPNLMEWAYGGCLNIGEYLLAPLFADFAFADGTSLSRLPQPASSDRGLCSAVAPPWPALSLRDPDR